MFYPKNYLDKFKGKKVTFQIVDEFPNLYVKFVDVFGDYKVKRDPSPLWSEETIKIQIDERFPDVKLQLVGGGEDIDFFMYD